jgi:deazaflavin-dependent oxidoreductase (nitroreductase family)
MAARGRSFGTVQRTLQKGVTAMHRAMYDLSGGRFGGTMMGSPVARLTTTGRKSGQQRATMLFAYPDGDDYIVVASNGGTATPPAWLLNLQADPAARLKVGRDEWAVEAHVMDAEEKAEWWPRVTAAYRGYESYQRKTDRDIPLVRLRRAG